MTNIQVKTNINGLHRTSCALQMMITRQLLHWPLCLYIWNISPIMYQVVGFGRGDGRHSDGRRRSVV